jgi:chromosome segregation ATPase
MYFELRKTQQKKHETVLRLNKANKVNAKLNVELASVTSTYEELLEDSNHAALAAHKQHELHIALTVNLHDEVERLESKLAGMETTHVSETTKVFEQLEQCANKTSEAAGQLKYMDQQVTGLNAVVATCNKELNFTKTQGYNITGDLLRQLNNTQYEKETLFTTKQAALQKIQDLEHENLDFKKIMIDDEAAIVTLTHDIRKFQNETEEILGEHKVCARTIFDLKIEIGNIKGRHSTTMSVVKTNTHHLEDAVNKCQEEKNHYIGTNQKHFDLLEACAERKDDLEVQVVLERNAHAEIRERLETTLKTCRNVTEVCEGKLEAHSDLLHDAKKRSSQLEDQLAVEEEKYDVDTKKCAAALKSEQSAKVKCFGAYAESETFISDCKRNVDALESSLNATTAELEQTTDECKSTIKTCQDVKQKCLGEYAAGAELFADIKENVRVLEGKLQASEDELETTTTTFTGAIDRCQVDKQKCVGESKAATALITECVDTRAELQTLLAVKAAANAKLANESTIAIKTCQDEKATCIGTNKVSIELVADCKSTAANFESKLGVCAATLAETTAQCDADFKQLQQEKQTCVGQNMASQTVIADCKLATAGLEKSLNKTTSILLKTAAQCDADVKQLQEEKVTCIGTNKASVELIANCKSTTADFESKLGKKTTELAETTAQCEIDVKQLQQEKQSCVGQNAAFFELIADCNSTAADFESKLGRCTSTLVETTAQCETDIKQLQQGKQVAVGRAAANDEVVKDLKETLQIIEKKVNQSEDESEEEIAAMVTKLKEMAATKEECLVKNGAHKTVIGDLESNVGRCETSLNKTRTTLAESTAESAAKVKELSAAREECLVKNGAHKMVIGDLEFNVDRLESNLNKTRTTLTESTAESAAKVKELSAAKEECLTRNGAHKTIVDDLESNVGRCETALNTTRTTLVKSMTESAAKVNSLTAEKEKLLVRNGAHKTIIEDLEHNADKCQSTLNTTRATLAESDAASAVKVKELSAAKEECLVKNGAHKTIIDDLSTNVGKCETALTETVQELKETSKNMTTQLTASRAAVKSCVTESGAHAVFITDLKNNVERCSTALVDTKLALNKTRTDLGARLKKSTAAKEECLVNNGAHKTIIDDLQTNVGRCEKYLNTTSIALKHTSTTLGAQVKELEKNKEFLLTQGGTFESIISDLEAENADAQVTIVATATALKNVTTTLNAQVKECVDAKAEVLIANGASKTRIANLEETVNTTQKELNTTRAECTTAAEKAAATIKRIDTARDDCVVKHGAHDAVVEDLHADIHRLEHAVDAVTEDLEDREDKLNLQLEKIFKKYERVLAQVRAYDKVKADIELNLDTATTYGQKCIVREASLMTQLSKSDELKEACAEKHTGMYTKIASLNDDIARLSNATVKEQAAHVRTKQFYEIQSGDLKESLATVQHVKNAAEAAIGKCVATVTALHGNVDACNEQIVINKAQVVKDNAYVTERLNGLDALVSGLRANNSECLVSFSRMENVASSTAQKITKCYAELNTTKAKVTEVSHYSTKIEEEMGEIVEELGECQNTDMPIDKLQLSPEPAPAVSSSPSETNVQGDVAASAEAEAPAEASPAEADTEAEAPGPDGSDFYPGTAGCEATCEGNDIDEHACAAIGSFCEWGEGKCWSAVGPNPCPTVEVGPAKADTEAEVFLLKPSVRCSVEKSRDQASLFKSEDFPQR